MGMHYVGLDTSLTADMIITQKSTTQKQHKLFYEYISTSKK